MPLEPLARSRFEQQLGQDLSAVVIHRSTLAGRLARAPGAEAASAGAHVLGDARLGSGTSGAALLAHELTHVIRGRRTKSALILQRSSIERRPVAGPSESEEALAQMVEGRILAVSQSPVPPEDPPLALDLDELTDRIYRRLVDVLLTERERAVAVG
jgi:hypothetical protein